LNFDPNNSSSEWPSNAQAIRVNLENNLVEFLDNINLKQLKLHIKDNDLTLENKPMEIPILFLKNQHTDSNFTSSQLNPKSNESTSSFSIEPSPTKTLKTAPSFSIEPTPTKTLKTAPSFSIESIPTQTLKAAPSFSMEPTSTKLIRSDGLQPSLQPNYDITLSDPLKIKDFLITHYSTLSLTEETPLQEIICYFAPHLQNFTMPKIKFQFKNYQYNSLNSEFSLEMTAIEPKDDWKIPIQNKDLNIELYNLSIFFKKSLNNAGFWSYSCVFIGILKLDSENSPLIKTKIDIGNEPIIEINYDNLSDIDLNEYIPKIYPNITMNDFTDLSKFAQKLTNLNSNLPPLGFTVKRILFKISSLSETSEMSDKLNLSVKIKKPWALPLLNNVELENFSIDVYY
jgi:hypothetical protein